MRPVVDRLRRERDQNMVLFTKVQYAPHVRQSLRRDDAVDDEAIAEFTLARGIGANIAQHVVRHPRRRADDLAPDDRISRIQADHKPIEKRQNGFMIVKQAGVGQQGEMAEFHFSSGASDELVDVGMEQWLASRKNEAVNAGSNDSEHLYCPIEIELLFGLRVAPRAEVLTVGAVKITLRRDVVCGDQRMKHAIATGESGEVAKIVGSG